MKQVLVTTSWDDSHKFDVRLSELLKKYDLKATFYVAPKNHEFNSQDLLTHKQIVAIGRDFEIGSHTITHPRLPLVTLDTARQEIVESKALLESMVKHTVDTFCYPRGEFRQAHADLVRAAGYRYARTVRRFSFSIDRPLSADTTIHAYRHWSDAWDILKFARFNPLRFLKYYFDWENLARAMFDYALDHGGVFHLWGHSWEIDKRHDWDRLERVFAYISARPEVSYVTNGELI
jgi:peptidoglycan/xylan/chitin deacetylase (PgdA/CDA1 family)